MLKPTGTTMPPTSTSGRYVLPGLTVLIAIAAMLWHGPIAQLNDYHHFADQRAWPGLPNVADVLSNLGFAAVGLWGLHLLGQGRAADKPGHTGYRLFFVSLLLTALGSGWYHLAPDNARLVWDRLPIALACAGLLSAVWHETLGHERWAMPALTAIAVTSVAWWRVTDLQGTGDLRPYLLVQLLPLVLIPMVQWQHGSPPAQRKAFGIALVLYVMAKVCELADHTIMGSLHILSGHTLKHLLATVAAGMVAYSLGLSARAPAAHPGHQR